MERSSFLHKLKSGAVLGARYLVALALNGYFWIGLATLVGIGLVIYFIVNALIMPSFTRHEATVRVPDVNNLTVEEAERALVQRGLSVGTLTQRLDRNRQPDVVIEQTPRPDAAVKPGRSIYLTINTGQIPFVTVPALKDLSLREARNRLQALGLTIKETLPDSIPSPYRNTVTRHRPAAGDSLMPGAAVTLWYSTGLGDRYVTVPDVTGMVFSDAERVLLQRRLRSVVVRRQQGEAYRGSGDPMIVGQSREPGTRVREGFEVRLFIDGE